MKHYSIRIIFSLGILLLSIVAFCQEGEWKLERNKEGVAVYTRKSSESAIREYKVLTTVYTDLETFVGIITNTKEFTKWMENLESATTLEEVNQNEFYNYFTADLPWPFDDRDMVVNLKLDPDYEKGECVAYSKTAPDYIKLKKGYERMCKGKGKWVIKQADKHVQVMYTFAGDPGLPLPAWIINMFLVDGPFKTFVNLREFVKENHASL